ncbi:hypothetical protein [Nocardioides piscis]|uniref:Uncharacterized protein n=1 Tax=Nocardioides piscis TaxID=2714938 RepID=A0A6G7YCQ1_9ACTN|nr:hypothetical protein [Nocardioides piscis]QIK74684.1 hypothetical protein G7071_03865 [Nocardioides piscis]
MYGDSAASRKRAAQLREQGGDIRAAADRLVAQAESVPWHGRAADAMRTRIKERANHLRAAAAHHENAADSLARHVNEVDARKEAIDGIQRRTTALVAERAELATFDLPPSGHKDWLTIETPGP